MESHLVTDLAFSSHRQKGKHGGHVSFDPRTPCHGSSDALASAGSEQRGNALQGFKDFNPKANRSCLSKSPPRLELFWAHEHKHLAGAHNQLTPRTRPERARARGRVDVEWIINIGREEVAFQRNFIFEGKLMLEGVRG